MKLRITNDGSLRTQVVNAETGEPIEMVRSVRWEHTGAADVPVATIEVRLSEVDVVVDGEMIEVTPIGASARIWQLVQKEN